MSAEKKILFATQNPGKVREVNRFFEGSGIVLSTPREHGIVFDALETGRTFEEIAVQKVEQTLAHLPFDAVVVADDSGLEIDALLGDPGVHTRRWIGRPMLDEEIYDHVLWMLNGVPLEERTAQFRSAVAVGTQGQEIRVFDGRLRGQILEKGQGKPRDGFPFAPLFYVPQWGRMLADTYDMPPEEKGKQETHRTIAFARATPYIKELSQRR